MKRLAIQNPWPGAVVYFKKKTASTMEDARRLFESGCAEGTVILADYQTRGRGRIGERRWVSSAGENLLFTLVLRTATARQGIGQTPQRFPLVAGLALALSLEDLYGLCVQLKWPNDLLLGDKKLAGILCEALGQGDSLGVLIGIGLNCNQRAFPGELESKATSLAWVLDRRIDLQNLLEVVLRKIKASLDDTNWRAKVVDRLYGLNRQAVLYTPIDHGSFSPSGQAGIVLGVNSDGSLLFKPENGTSQFVYGGEIRFAGP